MEYLKVVCCVLGACLLTSLILIFALVYKKKHKFTFKELIYLLFISENKGKSVLSNEYNYEDSRSIDSIVSEFELTVKMIIIDTINEDRFYNDEIKKVLTPMNMQVDNDGNIQISQLYDEINRIRAMRIPYINFNQIAIENIKVCRKGLSLNDNVVRTKMDMDLLMRSSEDFDDSIYQAKASAYITFNNNRVAELEKITFRKYK